MRESEREALFRRLEGMPGHLAEVAGRLGEGRGRRTPEGGGFSLVEHVWHLVDIEEEAYAVRIRRIREELDPVLADFEGTALAAERQYRLREIGRGLLAFSHARAGTLATLRSIPASEWSRGATQEVIGRITLEDLPRMMAEHDAVHRQELEQLLAESAMNEGHAAINFAVDRFRDAFEAGDVDAIAAYYTDDLVKLRQGVPAESKAELVGRLHETFREFDGRLEVTNDEIVTEGSFAFIRGRLVVTLTPKKAGEPRVLRRRFLEIWRREDGRWRVCRTMDNAGD